MGKAAPIQKIEGMDLKTFLVKMTPYIKQKLSQYLKQRDLKYGGDMDKICERIGL